MMWIVNLIVAVVFFVGGGVVGYWFCNRKVADKLKVAVDDKSAELNKIIEELKKKIGA